MTDKSLETPRPTGAGMPAPGRPRPPLRPWRPPVTVATVVLAGALAAVAHVGTPTMFVIALVVPMVMLAFGWVPLLRLPSPRGTTTVQLLAVAILLAPVLVRPEVTLDRLPAAVAVAMLVAFVHQLARRDARPRLVESVSASVAGIALAASAVCVVPIIAEPAGRDAATAVLVAVALAAFADVGLGRKPRGIIAFTGAAASVVLGALGAAAVHAAIGSAPLVGVWLAGAMAGGTSYALRQIQSVLPSLWGRRAQMASAAGSVLAAGSVAYGLVWASQL